MEIGETYGKLKVIGFDGKKVICECECGNTATPLKSNVRRGFTRSCGCLFKASASKSLRDYLATKNNPGDAGLEQGGGL